LFSTHILSDVEHICDEIAFLHDGKIVLQGSVEDVRKGRKAAATELETERTEDVRKLLTAFLF
jgi:ABC-2 type transport system ATP-binding protein